VHPVGAAVQPVGALIFDHRCPAQRLPVRLAIELCVLRGEERLVPLAENLLRSAIEELRERYVDCTVPMLLVLDQDRGRDGVARRESVPRCVGAMPGAVAAGGFGSGFAARRIAESFMLRASRKIHSPFAEIGSILHLPATGSATFPCSKQQQVCGANIMG
jgi:hypothetical protein